MEEERSRQSEELVHSLEMGMWQEYLRNCKEASVVKME